MRMICWENLPEYLQTEEVRPYFDALKKRRTSFCLKRTFDIIVSAFMLMALLPVFLFLAIIIKIDSRGAVFYRQERVTQYGKRFFILKFRTMIADADQNGELVTAKNDSRITRVGKWIRECRLDELPQLWNVLIGEMTFVGTRPEVAKYVEKYTPEMMATLLLPAGITSQASIRFKNEDALLEGAIDLDEVYIKQILPIKMHYNLNSILEFSFLQDMRTMWQTAFAILGLLQADSQEIDTTKEHTHL